MLFSARELLGITAIGLNFDRNQIKAATLWSESSRNQAKIQPESGHDPVGIRPEFDHDLIEIHVLSTTQLPLGVQVVAIAWMAVDDRTTMALCIPWIGWRRASHA